MNLMLPTENYKEDAPTYSPSPASGTYTAIVLKEHNKDLQPETNIGKKNQLWPDGLLQLYRWVRVRSIWWQMDNAAK